MFMWEFDLLRDQAIDKKLSSVAQSLELVHVVHVIKKMYHADQFTIALCVSDH